MVRHAPIVDALGPFQTSAEPNECEEARRICTETVMADRDWDDVVMPAELLRELGRHALAAVLAASLRVEQDVQERLWEHGLGSRLEPRYARYIRDAQWQAHEAVLAKTGSRKEAKMLQRRAARGRDPLTVCAGKRLRRLPESVLRYNAPDLLEHYGENIVPLGYGDGCGVIFLDSSEPRAPKQYCDRCRARSGNTMNAGLAKSSLARLKASRKTS